MQVIEMTMAAMGLIFGIIGFILGLNALIIVKAFEKSTHTITYKPVEEEIKETTDPSWATNDAAIDKDKKLYKEEIEEFMPELSPTEDEEKPYAF